MATDLLPDLNALSCYAIVLICGGLAAYWQISDRFKQLGAWSMLGTWTMWLAFTLVPVTLFFVLDRAGAIHDTSLFAALLVGFGYQQILSGQISVSKTPSQVSSLWQPFVRWSDWMAARINDRVARNDGRFSERLIADVVKVPAKFTKLRNLALQHATDPTALAAEVDKIKTDGQTAQLSNEVILDRQARKLYFALKALPDYQFLLVKDEIIDRMKFYWRTGQLKGAVVAYGLTILVALFLLLPVGAAEVAYARNAYPPYISNFYVWRLAKTNTTDADRFRTDEQLVAYLNDQRMASNVCAQLTALLRYGALTTSAADRDLGILLAGNPSGAQCHQALPATLIEALRTQNADIRLRINDSLVWLYSRDHSELSPELANWKPKPDEAPYEIEGYIATWRAAWSAPPAAGTASKPRTEQSKDSK